MSVDLKSLCEEWLGPVELKTLVARILDTLTAENYDTVSQELLGPTFPNMSTVCQQHPEVLKNTVDMFFSSVLNEKISATLCARLCKDITTQIPSLGEEFIRQLLDQSRDEYERGINLHKELDQLLPSEKETQGVTLRNRILANLRFVGELYKNDLYEANTLHDEGDEGLEMFCELMAIVGKQLDMPTAKLEHKQFMQKYFSKVTQLSLTYKTSRVRVKLQNLLDLRRNNWVREDGPNTPMESIQPEGKQRAQNFTPVRDEGYVPVTHRLAVAYLIQRFEFLTTFVSCEAQLQTLMTRRDMIPTDDLALLRRHADTLEKTHNVHRRSTKDFVVTMAKAIGLSPRHIYKCPNGHIYFIGDCGGAMEQSVCPDCKEAVGGAAHAVLSTNRFAGGDVVPGTANAWYH